MVKIYEHRMGYKTGGEPEPGFHYSLESWRHI